MTGQISLFDGTVPFKINKPIRLIELFAGIGSQAKALKRLGFDFEHWVVCEFDKYAVKSYNAIHSTNFDTSDITQLKGNDLHISDTDKYTYIITYSFPCQDLSKAGKGRGMGRDSGTRSGLLWEVERLLTETTNLPQVLLMENVPDVIGTKNMPYFAEWIEFLESLGYKNYWKCLNAKNYGIPQNRDRCFMVSLLGNYYYDFPQPVKLKLRLKDMLDTNVDEKYYLSDKGIEYITSPKRLNSWCKINSDIAMTLNAVGQTNWTGDFISELQNKEISNTVRSGGRGSLDRHCWDLVAEPEIKVVANINIPGRHESACRVYGIDGIAPTCNTCGGGGHETKILEPLAYDEQNNNIRTDGTVGALTTEGSNSKHNNRVVEPVLVGGVGEINFGTQFRQGNRIYDSSEIACALNASPVGNAGGNSYLYKLQNSRIRKLTPLECFRLMGFDDKDFYKAQAVNSNSQLYKQAGNSIVVNVLEAIFKQMEA